MSQYKVPQDVEAEDKIIGPLTLKQFIYAIIAVAWAGLWFTILKKLILLYLIVAFPVSLLFMLLAFYRRDGQNFEQLLIALVGFFANSRQRLWRKDDVVESFHVEPAKAAQEVSQRNPNEVRSELDRLANLIDSRGWNQPHTAEPGLVMPASVSTTTDRPIAAPVTAPDPTADTEPAKDILDLEGSPLGADLSKLIEQAAQDVKAEAVQQMQQPAKPAPKTAEGPEHSRRAAVTTSTLVTPAPSSDILKLANESDDLTVSQLAAQATRIVPLPEGQSVDLRANAQTSK